MSKLSKFDRTILGVMGILAVLLAGVWAAWQVIGMPAPKPDRSDLLVGARGPLGIQFGIPVDPVNAQKHIIFDPLLVGNFTWVGNTAYFWPYEPLSEGQVYTVRVDAGIQTSDNRALRSGAEWQVRVRAAEAVYLAPSRGPDLWRVDPQGGAPQQLTNSGGLVFDYAVAPDGESLVYSRYDEQGGVSLWRVDRNGDDDHLLLDCGADWCINPAFSPDGRQLAYARKLAAISEGSSPGVPRIWLMDLESLDTQRLYANPDIGGGEPAWSQDGRYLAFFDGIANGLHLANLVTHQDRVLPVEMGMTARWSPDSLSLLYTNIVVEETYAYETVFRYAVPTQQISLALGEDALPLDYSPVAFSADGQWLVVGVREITGGPARQMWLMGADGSDRQAVTQDPLVNTSAFSWSPGGEQVLYQSLALGSSSAAPQVMVWDRVSGAHKLLSADATRPSWLP
jgi:Tol biopolymer transport system component